MSDAQTPANALDAATGAPEGADEPIEGAQTEPVEAEARRMGWDPSKGPLSAEEFVTRGKEVHGFVKKHNEKLERDLKKATDEIASMKATFKEATAHFSKAEERGYKRAMEDLQSRQDEAVAAGDTEATRKITKEMLDLSTEMKGSKPSDQPGDFTQSLNSWRAENPWFDADPDLKAFAIGVGESLKATHSPEDQLPIIAQRVKAAFPAKFASENARRAAAPAVEGVQNGRRSAAKTWADLPTDAKAMADRFIKNGFIKDRAQYVASYQWDS